MKTITVPKAELLSKLVENKETHREVFEEALEGWRQTSIVELDALAEKLKSGKVVPVVSMHLPAPQDHTRDYERAIAMLEMDINDEVELTLGEFSQYVMDDWAWQREFLTSNSGYSGTAAALSASRYDH